MMKASIIKAVSCRRIKSFKIDDITKDDTVINAVKIDASRAQRVVRRDSEAETKDETMREKREKSFNSERRTSHLYFII